jgi:hypothetical protein
MDAAEVAGESRASDVDTDRRHGQKSNAPVKPLLPFPEYAELFVQQASETLAELFEADDDDEYLKSIAQLKDDAMVAVNYVAGASLNALAKRSGLDCPECRHMLVSKTKRVFCEFSS